MSNPEDAEGFEWDDPLEVRGNTGHLARKGITPREAEQVYYNGGKFVPNKKASGDWLLVGRTDGGRILTLVRVYQERRRLLRIFTGWASTDGERRRYL